MKVSDVNSSKAVAAARRKKKPEGRGAEFAEHLKDASETAEGGRLETSSLQSVDTMLAIQEMPGATEERSRGLARQHGHDLLDRLDQLRHDLLIGAVPKDRLAELARRVRARRRKSDDATLDEIIDEIELRAEVEIAKLTRDV